MGGLVKLVNFFYMLVLSFLEFKFILEFIGLCRLSRCWNVGGVGLYLLFGGMVYGYNWCFESIRCFCVILRLILIVVVNSI